MIRALYLSLRDAKEFTTACSCFISFLFFSQYTRHKSFVGGQIDASVLEMWEESVDGSGKGIYFLTFDK